MKKNKKGFTLMETLLVSAFIIGTLVYLFVQFSNIKTVYDTSFKRDTIPEIYYVQNLNLYLSSTDINKIISGLQTNNYVEIENCIFTVSGTDYCKKLMQMANVKKAIVVKDQLSALKEQLKNSATNPFSETMYQYIMDLSTFDLEKNRLIVEFTNGTVASLVMK